MGITPTLLRGYYTLPVWAQNAVTTAYGLRLRVLRYGRYHSRVLRDLLASQWLSIEEVRVRQLAKLNELLRHATTSVPFYGSRGLPNRVASLEELAHLPLLKKADLRTHGQELVSTARGARPTHEIHTGGTTGTPLSIRCDRKTLQRNYAFFSRFLRWAGVERRGRLVTIGGRTVVAPEQDRPPYWRFNHAAGAMMMSSYHMSPDTLDAYVEQLRAFKPDLIDSYPSSIEPIARHIISRGVRDIRPRAIVTSSETLHSGAREIVERAFGCTVFDQYGAAEMAAFVSQCEVKSYHVNPEYGILEVVKNGRSAEPGETGEIVATGFINPVMPLIRYATGDVAVQGPKEPCPCGRAFSRIERIVGRTDDVVITPEGRRIGRLDPIFKAGSSLIEGRIVQDQPDHVRLEVVPDIGYGPRDVATLREELERRLGPSMRVDVVEIDSVPRTSRGKVQMVVREIAVDRDA